MSVRVEKAESYRHCNSCGSNDRVLEIYAVMKIGRTTQGFSIALCNECAVSLFDALKIMADIDDA